jgi:hypothetical protein
MTTSARCSSYSERSLRTTRSWSMKPRLPSAKIGTSSGSDLTSPALSDFEWVSTTLGWTTLRSKP